MQKALIFFLSLFLPIAACQASFRIYLEDDVFREAHAQDSYSCEIYIRFSADDMCKVSFTPSSFREVLAPVFACTKVPDTILVQLTYTINKTKTMVENMIGYKKEEFGWRTTNYEVLSQSNKTEYKFCEEATNVSPPAQLKVLVKSPDEKLLVSLAQLHRDLIQFN